MAKRKFTEAEIISALEMAETVYRDACAQCIPDVADSRDLQTIRSRVKDQGLSFLKKKTGYIFKAEVQRYMDVPAPELACWSNGYKGILPLDYLIERTR